MSRNKKKFVITADMLLRMERAARRQVEIEQGLLGLRSPKVHRTAKRDIKRQNDVKREDYD